MICIILKWAIQHNEYFYYLYFKYILMLMLLYTFAGLFLATEYFYSVVLLLLLK